MTRIPPILLIVVALSAFALSGALWLTQPVLPPIAIISVIVGILCLITWALWSPEQVHALIRGRWLRFGGVALIVTVAFIVSSVLVYIVIREQGWRIDTSGADNFSLTEPARNVIITLSQDPTTPPIHIIGFLGIAQAGERDRITVLLDDFNHTSEGQITYEFIDADRNPLIAQDFGAVTGQYIISTRTNGELDRTRAQTLDFITQQSVLDALVTLTAPGDYRAYVLRVDDTLQADALDGVGMAILTQQLQTRFNWAVETITLFDLANPNDRYTFNDPSADGEVLLIAGGSFPLNDEQLQPLLDYMQAGGNVVILSGVNVNGDASLATSENLNTWLRDNYGVTIENDLIIDPFNAVQSPFVTRIRTFAEHPITQAYDEFDALDMLAPHSITLSDVVPDGVTVSPLAFSSDESYAKSAFDFSAGNLTDVDLALTFDDALGTFVVGASAESRALGGRIVVWGSESLAYNEYEAQQQVGIRNLLIARDSLFWASGFDSPVLSLPTTQLDALPQDLPLNATNSELGGIQFIAVFALPFGVFLIGFFVWWQMRAREGETF